mgnify:CR=1 FL=1
MIVELYTYEDNFRHIEIKDYSKLCDWEKDYMLLKISDEWVGHKIYNTTKQKFDRMTPVEKANSVQFQKFDKGAYINGKKE